MLKKSLFVLALTVVGTAVVSASTSYADLCVAAAAGGSAAAAGLASTGSSLNVGLWVLIGLVTLAVGVALAVVGRLGRSTGSSG